MKISSDIESIVSSSGVKLHLFEPSGRKIWTVVGKENEHWLDLDLGYCSCPDYYYNSMEKGKDCYHLKALRISTEKAKVETICFQDSEYENFLSALVDDVIINH